MALGIDSSPEEQKNQRKSSQHDFVAAETKSIDLVSMTSADSLDEQDNISIVDGHLQQWNFAEFRMQFAMMITGLLLLMACCLLSTWGINEYLKLISDIEQGLATWNSTDEAEISQSDILNELFSSKVVLVTFVIISYNIGCIFGAVVGAFTVPVLKNKIVYFVAIAALAFGGFGLMQNGNVYFYIKGRFYVGLAFGLVQVTLIVQAAESTTKKVRRITLTIIAYLCNLSTILSTYIVIRLDSGTTVSFDDESDVTTFIGYGILFFCALAFFVNLIFTQDTVIFLLKRGDETRAFKMLSKLKFNHLSMLDIRGEFERIRFDVIQEALMNNSVRAQSNFIPFLTMCAVRLLNLLYINIPLTLLLIWSNEEAETVDEDVADSKITLSPLGHLIALQSMRFIVGFFVTLSQSKYRFNRFVYKMSFLCGCCLFIAYVIYYTVGSFDFRFSFVYMPLSIMFAVSFVMLPLPLDVLQMNQSADSYAHCKNTWMLSYAIFIENMIHMMLIIQMDIIFQIQMSFIIIGGMMMLLSYWLLRHMPNECAVHPNTVVILARYPFKRMEPDETIHI